MRAANTPSEYKSEVKHYITYCAMHYPVLILKVVKRAEDHLLQATKARSYLKSQVEEAKKELKRFFCGQGAGHTQHQCLASALTSNMAVHFSFDFAQQVGLKSNNHYT
jgi:hypothetical protein